MSSNVSLSTNNRVHKGEQSNFTFFVTFENNNPINKLKKSYLFSTCFRFVFECRVFSCFNSFALFDDKFHLNNIWHKRFKTFKANNHKKGSQKSKEMKGLSSFNNSNITWLAVN